MQGNFSNPLKVLIKENKVIYKGINQLNSVGIILSLNFTYIT